MEEDKLKNYFNSFGNVFQNNAPVTNSIEEQSLDTYINEIEKALID